MSEAYRPPISTSPTAPTSQDQTQFDTDAWMYDANKSQPIQPDPTQVKPPFWKTRQGKLTLIPLGLVIILILIAAVVMMTRNDQTTEITAPTDQTTFANLDLGPLGDKVKALSAELKAADPTKELDPFPPVRLDLRLDEVTQ